LLQPGQLMLFLCQKKWGGRAVLIYSYFRAVGDENVRLKFAMTAAISVSQQL
jgi:hypothetical protein